MQHEVNCNKREGVTEFRKVKYYTRGYTRAELVIVGCFFLPANDKAGLFDFNVKCPVLLLWYGMVLIVLHTH